MLKEPGVVRIITAVTFDFVVRFFKRWNDIGFITRFVPISYKYSDELIKAIHTLIEEDGLLSMKGKVNAAEGCKIRNNSKIDITIEKNAASFISIKANEFATNLSKYKVAVFTQGGHKQYITPNIYGFRLHRQ